MSALARWDAFLAQVAGRHRQVRTEAAARAVHTLSQLAAGADHRPLMDDLAMVDRRLRELEKKIGDTWRDNVDAAIAAEGQGADVRAAAQEKGIALQRSLDGHREELLVRVRADVENEVRRRLHLAPMGPPGASKKP